MKAENIIYTIFIFFEIIYSGYESRKYNLYNFYIFRDNLFRKWKRINNLCNSYIHKEKEENIIYTIF